MIQPPTIQPGNRFQERAFWGQAIGQCLSFYDKSSELLPEELSALCRTGDLSAGQINQTQLNRLWELAAQLSEDPCFGLRTGQLHRSPSLQTLSLAASCASNLTEAIQRIVRYFPVCSTQIQLYSIEDDQALTLVLQPRGNPHPMHLEALLAQCAQIWKHLHPDPQSLILETRLTSDLERYRNFCEEVLGSRVRMSSKRLAIRLNRTLLRQPLPGADSFLLKRLEHALSDMLEELPNVDFSEQVKQRIRNLIASREVSEELVAAPFNMSSRHLRRKLGEVDTSYEKLLDEVRLEIASRLIREGRLNLGRVAFELGFLDPSSFTRAFRRWTGMSPTSFREKLMQTGD